MNWNVVEGKWDQMKGEVKARWAKLTQDDIELLAAHRDKLVGKIIERYGVLRDEAERQVDEWTNKVGGSAKPDAQGKRVEKRPVH